MTTYNNAKNGLMFFSCKCFLDSVDTIFHFRWVSSTGSVYNQDNYENYVLEFKLVDEDMWQRKAVNICLTTNYIHLTPEIESYTIVNDTKKDDDEIADYYKVKELLLNLLTDATTVMEPRAVYDQHELNLYHFIKPPIRFTMDTFVTFQKKQGLVTIRISYGTKSHVTHSCFLNWSFNSSKYIMKREPLIKKRKMEAEIEPETKSIEIVSEEIKSEI